jgi:AcrR family transcriptional regulator
MNDTISPPINRQKRSEATRRRLLEAAAEVFVEQGYENTAVAEIARRASVTTGAIYYSFRGKAELLLEVIRTRLKEETDSFKSYVRSSSDVNRGLLELVRDSRQAGRPETRALLLESFAVARREPTVRQVVAELLAESFRFVASGIRAGQERGLIDKNVDAQTLAWLYMIPAAGEAFTEAAGVPLPPLESWLAVFERLTRAFAAPCDALTSDGPGRT